MPEIAYILGDEQDELTIEQVNAGEVTGIETTMRMAYDYYAYGTAEEIVHNGEDDNKCWQGKEYDEPIRKLYFGSRYYDSFFGMWMSPDPAGQFANPYTYGGDPMNYVDPNGEWVQIAVGAIIGAVVGTVNGAIQCTAPGGGGSCTKSVTTGFVGGAAVGAAAAATGGAVGAAAGGGFAGAVAGGAAGGVVSGVGNYATNAFVNGSGVSWSGAWDATWKGAATGAIGGGVGSVAGNYMAQGYAQMVGGFAGGASGSAFNDGSGWQILQGGLMGAGMSLVSTLVSAGMGDLGSQEVNECKHNCTSDRDFLKGGDYESKVSTRVKDIDGDYTVAFDRAESGNDVLDKIVDYHLAELNNHTPGKELLGLYDSKGDPLKWSFVEGGDHSATFNDLKLGNRIRFAFTNTKNLYVMHNHPTTALGSRADFEMSGNYKAAYMIHTSGNAVYKNSVYHEYKSSSTGLYKQAYIKW